MDIISLLEKNKDKVIEESCRQINEVKLKGYTKVGSSITKQKLTSLYKKVIECANKKELIPMLNYTEKIAKERFASGYDLHEVQTAINALEENIWQIIFKNIKPDKLAESLGLVSSILGAGKDNLARNYVALATQTKASTINLQSLLSGSESIADNG
ncbi:MAG: hypothetical protein WC139_06210 [Candidatus Kapaibacterium sp.]